MKHFLTTNDIASREELEKLYRRANDYRRMDRTAIHTFLQGCTLGSVFRYRDGIGKPSIETAMWRLGGRVFDADLHGHQMLNGSGSFQEELERIGCFSDIIAYAVNNKGDNTYRTILDPAKCSKPLINCGCYKLGNPLQALTDLYTIWDHRQGDLDNLKITPLADLQSPIYRGFRDLVSRFCPGSQILAERCCSESCRVLAYSPQKQKWEEFEASLSECDVLYVSRVYREFRSGDHYSGHPRILKKLDLSRLGKAAILVHPMTAGSELAPELAEPNPQMKTWENVRNGIFVRMAVLESLLT